MSSPIFRCQPALPGRQRASHTRLQEFANFHVIDYDCTSMVRQDLAGAVGVICQEFKPKGPKFGKASTQVGIFSSRRLEQYVLATSM